MNCAYLLVQIKQLFVWNSQLAYLLQYSIPSTVYDVLQKLGFVFNSV